MKLICTFNQHCLSYKISNRLQFNSSLFPTNYSKCCYIGTLFIDMCHTFKTRLNTQIPMHMSFVDLCQAQVSFASR